MERSRSSDSARFFSPRVRRPESTGTRTWILSRSRWASKLPTPQRFSPADSERRQASPSSHCRCHGCRLVFLRAIRFDMDDGNQ